MCGLTGLLALSHNKKRSELQAIGRSMADCLRHRGPDDGDVWQDLEMPVVLAHRRLAIIDLSPQGHQPMASASGRYTIAYNGEIYNFQELRKELEALRITFRGRSDTEVILAAIEQWGLNQALQKINGMFAIVLWDNQIRQLHFARDRLGKKPLYIGWAGDNLVFGSELKSLRAHPDFKPEINNEGLSLFLKYGYVTAPHSIYKNVWVLPPGSRLSVDATTIKPQTDLSKLTEIYWHHLHVLEEAHLHPVSGSDQDITNEFEELLESCVRERMISDVPLGAFLSGGIDSSTIVALMQKNSPRPVKTYTIGFHEAEFNEAKHAAKIASHLGTDHHEFYLSGDDALNVIPELPDIYDEPFADISAIPTYLVSKFARFDVTVALSGDGGDEMLGGYNRHIQAPKLWRRMKMIPRPLRALAGSIIQRDSSGRFNAHAYKAASLLALNTQEDIYERLISQWPLPPLKHPSIPSLNPQFQTQDLSFAESMMYRDTLSYLPDDILVKVDRASMAVSLETRAPLLDRKIYEYTWRLPEHYKIRNGQGKWLLRQVLERHVPSSLFERPKQGFSIPVGEWLRGPLRDWAENLLDEKKLHHLDAAPIRQCWSDHLAGRGNNSGKLWTILMFQAWQERWLSV